MQPCQALRRRLLTGISMSRQDRNLCLRMQSRPKIKTSIEYMVCRYVGLKVGLDAWRPGAWETWWPVLLLGHSGLRMKIDFESLKKGHCWSAP